LGVYRVFVRGSISEKKLPSIFLDSWSKNYVSLIMKTAKHFAKDDMQGTGQSNHPLCDKYFSILHLKRETVTN
jgi:hypothetical protein